MEAQLVSVVLPRLSFASHHHKNLKIMRLLKCIIWYALPGFLPNTLMSRAPVPQCERTNTPEYYVTVCVHTLKEIWELHWNLNQGFCSHLWSYKRAHNRLYLSIPRLITLTCLTCLCLLPLSSVFKPSSRSLLWLIVKLKITPTNYFPSSCLVLLFVNSTNNHIWFFLKWFLQM